MTQETAVLCVADFQAGPQSVVMDKIKLPRPNCRRINPESDGPNVYCQTCGYSLVETKTGWYRHGERWVHPNVWTHREDGA